MDIEYAVVVMRSIERYLIVLSAIVCIICGTFMLIRGVTGSSDAEWRSSALSLKLFKISPGVFFGLFGAVILVFSIQAQVKYHGKYYSNPNSLVSSKLKKEKIKEIDIVSYGGGNLSQVKIFQARNTLLHVINTNIPLIGNLMEKEKAIIKKASDVIVAHHYNELSRIFKEDLQWFQKINRSGKIPETDEDKRKYIVIKEHYDGMLK